MKSGHDYRGELASAMRRQRRAIRKWQAGRISHAEMRLYGMAAERKQAAHSRWLFSATQNMFSKVYKDVDALFSYTPLLAMVER